ncbi:hypothetical protein J2S09_001296 [Bacillus fengqiuensis]|nr:hypothetical protein [Bacillus fengqiuensis]
MTYIPYKGLLSLSIGFTLIMTGCSKETSLFISKDDAPKTAAFSKSGEGKEMSLEKAMYLSPVRVFPSKEHYINSGTVDSFIKGFADKRQVVYSLTAETGEKESFIITSYKNNQSISLNKLKEKYAEVTYEEADQAEAVHWMVGNAHYQLLYEFGESPTRIGEEEYKRIGEQNKERMDQMLEDPAILPAFLLFVAFEEQQKLEAVKGWSYSENENGDLEYIDLLTEGTYLDENEALKTAQMLMKSLYKTEAKWEFFDKKKWEEKELQIRFKADSSEDPYFTFYKDGKSGIATSPVEQQNPEGDDSQEGSVSVSQPDELEDAKMAELETSAPIGFQVSDMKKLSLTGGKVKEIVVIYNEISPQVFPGNTILQVHRFDKQSRQWVEAFNREFEYTPLEFLTSSTDGGTEREEAAIGSYEGSGGFLSFIILGSPDHKTVSTLLEKMDGEYVEAEVYINNRKVIVEDSSGVVDEFKWNGSSYQ